MNKFLMLLVLLNSSFVKPDLSLGYRYIQRNGGSGDNSFLHIPGLIATSYYPSASSNSYFESQPCLGQIGDSRFLPSIQLPRSLELGSLSHQSTKTGFNDGFGASSFTSNSGFTANTQTNSGSFLQNQQDVQQQFAAPIVSKHFYVHTAPSDDDEEEIVRHVQIGQLRKNYRVVFINTPSLHSTKAKIIADVAPTEEKTAIYVLSMKNNALDIKTEVNTRAPVASKPEVFFVKYKTLEEAVQVQHTIQAQYDALAGSTDISHEGTIPVSSVIGSFQGGSSV